MSKYSTYLPLRVFQVLWNRDWIMFWDTTREYYAGDVKKAYAFFLGHAAVEHKPVGEAVQKEKQSFSPKPQKPACVQLNLFDNE